MTEVGSPVAWPVSLRHLAGLARLELRPAWSLGAEGPARPAWLCGALEASGLLWSLR